jgi:hypothetical protein
MALAVTRRHLAAEAGFIRGSVSVGFVVDRVALGQVFLRVRLSALPCLAKPGLSALPCLA